MAPKKPKRTIFYIDGFNLYHGLKEKGWRRYLWLNLHELSIGLLPPGHKLELVRYFTARVKGLKDDPDKPVRQSLYIDALETLKPHVEIQYGRYQAFQSHCRHCNNMVFCAHCGKEHVKPNEKKTDVNIMTALLVDLFENKCDTQMLVSGDSDYEITLEQIRRLFPKKELVLAFPPRRRNHSLIKSGYYTHWQGIAENSFAQSQFPDPVLKTVAGKQISLAKPTTWV